MKKILILIATLSSLPAAAQSSCELVQKLSFQLGCSTGGHVFGKNPEDFIVRQIYETGCKTGSVLENAKKTQNSSCQNWLAEKKTNLGKKYQTGTCQEMCQSCNDGLEKCVVTGVVHYSK